MPINCSKLNFTLKIKEPKSSCLAALLITRMLLAGVHAIKIALSATPAIITLKLMRKLLAAKEGGCAGGGHTACCINNTADANVVYEF
jgi:hypothetical protein